MARPELDSYGEYGDLPNTRPDCPNTGSGARLRAPINDDDAADMEHRAEATIRRLEGYRSILVDRLRTELKKTRDEFRSWQLCQPTLDVRHRIRNRFMVLDAQAKSFLGGGR